ncbi:MAG: hypothetical protein ACK4IX_18390, partial [Candidatus Sericytochromatia bacterium]
PLYVSSNVTDIDLHINIGLYKDHYVWIKNISALLSTVNIKDKHYYCPNCLVAKYRNKDDLVKHIPNCMTHQSTKIKMPTGVTNDKGIRDDLIVII